MKLLNKKTLSVALAGVMALSSLTLGSVSALAADANDFATAVNEGTNNIVATKVKFTPSKTANYNIALTTTKNGKSAKASYEYSSDINELDYDSEYSNTVSSESFETLKENTVADTIVGYDKDDNPIKKATGTTEEYIYSPAQTTAKLIAGTTYYFELAENSVGNGISSALTINKDDFKYSFIEAKSDITYVSYYNYNSSTNNYDAVKDTSYVTTGMNVTVDGYIGSSKNVYVPAGYMGYAVKEANINAVGVANKKIESVSIPEGVEKIGGMSDMYALKSVSLPSTLKTIDSYAFACDHALTGRLVIPANVEKVGDYAFYDTGYSSVQVLGANTTFGEYALGYNEVLNEATANPTDTTSAPVEKFIIVAPAASEATTYAVQNNFAAYDPANCVSGNHPYEVTKVAATVFAKGSVTSTCPVCGNTVKTTSKKKTFKISSVKSSKKKTIVIKAAKQKEMAGYKVQYSTSKKFTKKTTKTVKVATKKALKKTVKGLKSGKKYYVRVRAYKVANGKTVYSAWTKTKSVKVK